MWQKTMVKLKFMKNIKNLLPTKLQIQNRNRQCILQVLTILQIEGFFSGHYWVPSLLERKMNFNLLILNLLTEILKGKLNKKKYYTAR